MPLNNIVPLSCFKDNYIWAILDTHNQCFDCVDPGDPKPVMDFNANYGFNLRNILVTHHHEDHIGGVKELVKQFPNSTVYGPEDSRIPEIQQTVKAEDLLRIGNHTYQILCNPGHTSSHISYYEAHQGWLFCGDTLFSVGCGRVFDGTVEQLHDSLSLFKQLPASTLIYCAHEYTRQNIEFALTVEPTNQYLIDYAHKLQNQSELCSLPSTMQLECAINPFLRTDKPEVIEYAQVNGAIDRSSLEVLRTLREKKNQF